MYTVLSVAVNDTMQVDPIFTSRVNKGNVNEVFCSISYQTVTLICSLRGFMDTPLSLDSLNKVFGL
jgi:hypothetical protein